LTAASLEAKLVASDERFAKVIIQLMGPMLEQGHLSYMHGGGWGYTWSQTTVLSLHETLVNREGDGHDYRTSELDRKLGFNAFAYRKRFRKVEQLAVQDLFHRGFDVKHLEICVTDLSIGVKWIIEI
jgi:hypothetical protein